MEVYDLFRQLMREIKVQVEADPIFTSSQVNTILSIQPNSYAQIKAILLNQTSFFFLQKEKNRILEAEHEFNENVPDLEIPSVATLPTNSQVICRDNGNSLT
jgi:hypothetical protein